MLAALEPYGVKVTFNVKILSMITVMRLSKRVKKLRGLERLRNSASCFSALRSPLTQTRLAGMALAWMFSAFLLFGQGVDLIHSHNGDLTSRVDCEICFVTGSLGQAVSASGLALDLPTVAADYDSPAASPISTAPPVSKARAPPIS